jgi:hypothetical protein
MNPKNGAPVRIDGEWLLLLREALDRGERFRWSLQGTSMCPTLPPGCRIEIAALIDQPAIGDIVVFVSSGELVAHRLVRRVGAEWITQGDGRLGPDRPIAAFQVLGTVVSAVNSEGRSCWPGRLSRVEACLWVARYHAFRLPRRMRKWFRNLAGNSAT